MITLIFAFLGVPVLVLLNISASVSLALSVHALLGFAACAACIKKYGSADRWARLSIEGTRIEIHTTWILLFGLLFTLAGSYLAAFGRGGDAPNAMNRTEIIYFGSIFILLGLGIGLVAIGRLPKRGSNNFTARNPRKRAK